ncbi:MAG: hypothetical protein ACK4GC_14340 [Paracoccaceae bacterium]
MSDETNPAPARRFRNSASFGKRIEYWIIGLLLKQGFDVFVPLVDDDGIDAILRHPNGKKVDLQIKARSTAVGFGDAALFAALTHPEKRDDYYFIFYAERMDMIWLMSSADFLARANENKNGKNAGKRSIWFNGRSTRSQTEHPYPKFEPWRISHAGVHDFSRLQGFLETGNDPMERPE